MRSRRRARASLPRDLTEPSRFPLVLISDSESVLVKEAGLDWTAERLTGFEIYDSIYNPGKVLGLALWTAPEDATSMHLPTMPGIATDFARCA